jgi:hypothetical protein
VSDWQGDHVCYRGVLKRKDILCQVVRAGESLVTVWADVRSLLGMGSHVSRRIQSQRLVLT